MKEEIKTKIRIISYHAILIGHRTSWGITVEGNVKEINRKDQNQKLSSQHKKYRHKINGVKKINQKKKEETNGRDDQSHTSLAREEKKKRNKEIPDVHP